MKQQHVLFGVSPFNSKFTAEYLYKMLDWGFDNYNKVSVVHPCEEARYLLIACGDDETKARKKCRKEFNRVDKIIDSYLAMNNISLASGHILKFSSFYHIPQYQYFLEKCRCDYLNNQEFQSLCNEQSMKVVLQRSKHTQKKPTLDQNGIAIATEYILMELPFLIAPSVILSMDEDIHISYYCEWPVADFLYKGKLSLTAFSRTKLVIKDHEEK